MAKGKKNFQDYNGIKFNNETEVEFYKLCEIAVSGGRIQSFKYEVFYELFPQFTDWRGCKIDSICHTPDFLLTLNDGSIMLVDTKGGGSQTHDKVSLLKRKIWMANNQSIPYYMISKSPAYLGSVWCETSPSHDFISNLKSTYKKLFPNENVKKWGTCKKFLPNEWGNWYEFNFELGLFHVMIKKYTKKELIKINK